MNSKFEKENKTLLANFINIAQYIKHENNQNNFALHYLNLNDFVL